jgi:hypothetical protein
MFRRRREEMVTVQKDTSLVKMAGGDTCITLSAVKLILPVTLLLVVTLPL